MDHLSPARLAAVDRTTVEVEHLAGCARCRSQELRVRAFAGSDSGEGPALGSGSAVAVASAPLAPPPSERLAVGTQVDRYVIEGVLGEGGMAVVYRARHAQLGSAHAIKVLTIPSKAIRERLLMEGRVQANIRSRNVVPVTDIVDVDGAPGLVMELVDGPSLAELLLTCGRLPIEQVDELARGILAGAAAAHRAGLIHRDLKPGNILLARTDEGLVPKITDFGLAKVLDAVEDADLHHTRSSATLGSPRYMSPEQIRSAKGVDPRSDVFSLGAILYELVTGSPAFEGRDLMEIFTAITEGRYRPVRELAPDAPDRAVAAIEAALQVSPDARPQDVEALASLWRGPVADAASLPPSSPPRLAPRVRPAWVAVAFVLVAVLGLAVYSMNAEGPGTVAAGKPPATLGDASAVAQTLAKPASYLPLAVGNWWEYRMVEPETQRAQPKNKKLVIDLFGDVGGLKAGTQGFRMRREDALGSSVRWLGKEGDVVAWLHDEWMDASGTVTKSQYYQPYRTRLDETPAHLVNEAEWTEEYDDIGIDPTTGEAKVPKHVQVTWTVEALDEAITVPAGSFNCLRLRRRNRQSATTYEDQTYWFARGVGKVREDSPPAEHEELIAYHVE